MIHPNFPVRSGKALLQRKRAPFSSLDPRPDTDRAFDRFLPMQRLLRSSELSMVPRGAYRRELRRQRAGIFQDYLGQLKKTVSFVQEGSRDAANSADGFDFVEELTAGFEVSAILLGLRLALCLYVLHVSAAGELVESLLFALEFSVFRAAPSTATT